MRYINTKRITAHILTEQLVLLEEIQKEIEIECGIKIPLTEIIRQALNEGLPRIKGNKRALLKSKGI